MEYRQILLLTMALVSFLGSWILSIEGSFYRGYKKLLSKILSENSDILKIKEYLIQIKELLEKKVVCYNEKERNDLQAYQSFLKAISDWESISDIQINLENRRLQDWMFFSPKKHIFAKVGKILNNLAFLILFISILYSIICG